MSRRLCERTGRCNARRGRAIIRRIVPRKSGGSRILLTSGGQFCRLRTHRQRHPRRYNAQPEIQIFIEGNQQIGRRE